eukprot:TRINITY_DN651_c0_g3_i2.p1 TRINITY_DN651_c0_g3~~TRINITY_DN651_c0_g3_i2.p1  ORF type:complete len:489 (+),score=141.17 TRINITY_DN651_c0_g3_i2:162-1628(+)
MLDSGDDDSWVNYGLSRLGCRVVDCSTEVEGCESWNILHPDRQRVWVSAEGPPQSLTLRLPRKRLPITHIGILLLHEFSTNPRLLGIQVRSFKDSESFEFTEWCELSCEQRIGKQVFAITPIPEDLDIIRVDVLSNYGGEKVYIHQIFFYSDPAIAIEVEEAGSQDVSNASSTKLSPIPLHASMALASSKKDGHDEGYSIIHQRLLDEEYACDAHQEHDISEFVGKYVLPTEREKDAKQDDDEMQSPAKDGREHDLHILLGEMTDAVDAIVQRHRDRNAPFVSPVSAAKTPIQRRSVSTSPLQRTFQSSPEKVRERKTGNPPFVHSSREEITELLADHERRIMELELQVEKVKSTVKTEIVRDITRDEVMKMLLHKLKVKMEKVDRLQTLSSKKLQKEKRRSRGKHSKHMRHAKRRHDRQTLVEYAGRRATTIADVESWFDKWKTKARKDIALTNPGTKQRESPSHVKKGATTPPRRFTSFLMESGAS